MDFIDGKTLDKVIHEVIHEQKDLLFLPLKVLLLNLQKFLFIFLQLGLFTET
jgi:hypothetical protein